VGAREDLLGAWRLVSMVSRSSNGDVRYPFGTDARGLIIWDAHGWFSAQIAPGGEGATADAGQYVAYFGTWEMDEAAGELVHHVAGSFSERLRGTDQRRRFTFESGRLLLQPPPTVTGSETVSSTVTWERT
jgi:Lipocalin-like domain